MKVIDLFEQRQTVVVRLDESTITTDAGTYRTTLSVLEKYLKELAAMPKEKEFRRKVVARKRQGFEHPGDMKVGSDPLRIAAPDKASAIIGEGLITEGSPGYYDFKHRYVNPWLNQLKDQGRHELLVDVVMADVWLES